MKHIQAAVVVNEIGQILPYSVQATRPQTEARMMDIMGDQAWQRAKLMGSRVEKCAIVLSEAEQQDDGELSMSLAVDALNGIDADTFSVSANLSNAQSLSNFAKFQAMLLQAYRRGAREALASQATAHGAQALEPCSEETARAVIENTATRLLTKV